MKRIFKLILLVAFVGWLLPLGSFIKADNEYNFCGGQRAICMCGASKVGPRIAGLDVSSSINGAKNAVSSQSPGSYLALLATSKQCLDNTAMYFIDQPRQLYALLLTCNIEHVPYFS